MHIKSIKLLIMYILFTAQTSADDNWTSYRPNESGVLITSVVAVEDKIWYGSNAGLSCYNKQDHSITTYTLFDGLISNDITDMALDQDGTLWIATTDGVSSFDGDTWQSFPNEDYFNHYTVKDIYVDRNNHIWFPAVRGVFRFDGTKWDMFREPYFDKSMRLISAGGDRNGTVWFGSESRGIARFDGTEWTYYEGFDDLSSNKFVTIIDDKEGTLWFGTFNGILFSFDGMVWKKQNIISKQYAKLYEIEPDETGRMWAATSQGLTRIDNTFVTVYEQDGTVFNSSLRSLSIDELGVVWVGGYKGISEFNGTTFVNPTIIQGPFHKETYYIAITPDNIKWFGHYELEGVSRLDGNNWSAHIFDYNSVGKRIAIDNKGTVWFTAGGHGALSFDGNRVENYYFNLGWEYINADISEVAIDMDNRVWFTGYRTYAMGETSYTVSFHNNKLEKYHRAMYFFNSPDNVLWRNTGGHSRGDIEYYLNDEWIHYETLDFGFKEIVIDKNGVLWLIVSEMIEYPVWYDNIKNYDGYTWKTYKKNSSGLPSNFIYSIAIDKNNVKWFGTDSGAARFDGETWKTFDIINSGLINNKVNAIAVEKNNTIWFGTDKGVSKYTGEIITTSVDEDESKPEALPVIKTYPNPFNPATTIEFELPETGIATLIIYNIAGQKIRELISGYNAAGIHRIVWDGTDDSGKVVSAGMYIVRLKAGEVTATGKMVLVR